MTRALASLAASLFFVVAVCASSPQSPKESTAPTAPTTIEAARKFLEGRWVLVSYTVFPPGKPPVELTGGSGSLTYDSHGNLEMQIHVADKEIARDLEYAGIPLREGVLETTGRTIINMQEHTLSFLLSGESPLRLGPPSGPLALSRPRHWGFDGSVLTLTTKGDDGKPVSIGRWRKEK